MTDILTGNADHEASIGLDQIIVCDKTILDRCFEVIAAVER